MNVGVFCDSRGRGLGPELHRSVDTHQVYVYPFSGATFDSIVPIIREFNSRVLFDAIYILVGNNDITKLDRDTHTIYIEENNPHDIVEAFDNKLIQFKLQAGAIMGPNPVIVLPITPIELSIYNKALYRDPKQWIVNMSINTINSEILYQNTWNNYSTPLLHEVIYRAEGQGGHRYYFNRLIDGLHPKPATIRKWSRKLRRALWLNGHI